MVIENIPRKSAIISLSGGLDSSTLLYDYRDGVALAVSFDYGSRHNKQEISCASRLCKLLNIEHKTISLSFIEENFVSNLLMGQGSIPKAEYDADNMASTVVPFRNGIMLSILAGMAESSNLKYILIANHFGDHFIYPDCRESFVKPMSIAIEQGTSNNVKLIAPYTLLSKADIVQRGNCLSVPYEYTYSCYCGGEKHCGECATCRERKAAFRETGIADPTIYML